jgi:uncharacterized membrane protein YbhN (UPF0104 family)
MGLSVIGRIPRTLLWLIVLGTFASLFLLHSGGELKDAMPVVLGANPFWVVIALAIQLLMLCLVAGKYWVLMNRLHGPLPPTTLARAHLRRHFVSTTLPLGGPAGLVSFVRDMARVQVCASKAVAVSIRASMVNQVAFVLYLIPALGWLALAGKLSTAMALAFGGILVLAVLGLTIAVLLLRSKTTPALVRRLPARVVTGLEEIRAHGIRPGDIASGVPFAFLVNIASLLMLASSVWASGHNPGLTTILATRVVATLAMAALPIFQGMGVMEVSIVGMLHASGIPVADALGATMIFRVAQFWMPLAMGALVMARWQAIGKVAWNGGPTRFSQAAAACLVIAPIGLALLEFDVIF